MELFKLFGTIAVNNKDANSAIDETSEKAEGFGSKLKKGVSTVAKWGTAVVGGATAAAGALVKFAESSASTADHVDKMSQKIGISRQAYQELDFICSQSGTSVDSLQAGMKSLVSAMDGAASGTASNVEQFNKLGVSVTNADGSLRSSEEVMWETLSALQSMDNETEKARLATELFGRSGTELLPLLNSESGSLEEMKQQAHDLGLVLDDELIDSGVSLTDTIDQMKRSFSSIVTQLGASLMPIVEKVSKYVIDNMPKIHSLFTKLEPIITGLLDGLLPPLMDLAEQLLPIIFDLIEQLLPPITQIIRGVLPIITNLLTTLLPPLIQIVQILLPPLMVILEALMPILNPIFDILLTLVPFFKAIGIAIVSIVGAIKAWSAAQAILNFVLNANPIGLIIAGITALIVAITAIIKYWNEIKANVLEPIADFFSNLWDKIWNGIVSVFSAIGSWVYDNIIAPVTNFFRGLWEGIVSTFHTVIDPWIEIIKRAASWFNETVVQPVINAFTKIWDSIKDGAKKAWEGVKKPFSAVADWFKNIFSKAWQAVKNVFSTGGKIFDGIKDGIVTAFKAVVNAIIRGINKVIAIPFNAINKVLSKINGINILGVRPFSWVHTFNVPQIPQLAKGGVLPKGKTGYLEGDGAEAVVPLEKNTEWTLQVAKQIFEYSENKGKEKPKDTVVNITLNIERFVNEREQDLKELVETVSEMLAAQIRRKGLSF